MEELEESIRRLSIQLKATSDSLQISEGTIELMRKEAVATPPPVPVVTINPVLQLDNRWAWAILLVNLAIGVYLFGIGI